MKFLCATFEFGESAFGRDHIANAEVCEVAIFVCQKEGVITEEAGISPTWLACDLEQLVCDL